MRLEEIKRLTEMNAIAAYGNWEISEEDGIVVYRSATVMKTHFTQITTLKIPAVGIKKVMKLDAGYFYTVGDFVTKGDETKFAELFQITLIPTTIPNLPDKYMKVDGVKVPAIHRGIGIATTMYRYLSKDLKFKILGDKTQYFGARKLWAKLSKMLDVTVDIIDIRDGKMLEEDVVLHHGTEDWEFDDRVWSYDIDKKHIRLILKDL